MTKKKNKGQHNPCHPRIYSEDLRNYGCFFIDSRNKPENDEKEKQARE